MHPTRNFAGAPHRYIVRNKLGRYRAARDKRESDTLVAEP